MAQDREQDGQSIGTRWPELGMAAFLFLLGVLVVVDSIRVGTGWGDDGPRSGYFPFYIGLILLSSSGFIAVKQLLRWREPDPEFAERSQIASVLAVLIPMVIYVVLIALIGIYPASALLIGYFMRHHGKYGWAPVLAVSIAVPLAFYLVFERWFLVLLPKGLVGQAFGL